MNAVRKAQGPETGQRVLVIDDHLDNVRSLALLFDSMGHQVEYAINAAAGIDLARRCRPDIIFLDLLLPDGHGSKVCRELRESPGTSKARIIAITASSRMIDHQLALDAGCDDVLRKPVSPETFERLITGGMNRRKLRDFLSDQGNKTRK